MAQSDGEAATREDGGPSAEAAPGGCQDLHTAATHGDVDSLRKLLARGDDKDAQNAGGLTPLHLAAEHGFVDCLRELLAAGADKEARNNIGTTPLMFAACGNALQCLTELLRAGSKKEARDKLGRTALMHAAEKGHAACLAALLDAGCEKEAESGRGRTPLSYAAGKGDPDSLRELLAARCNKDAPDRKGRRPLHYVAEGGNVDCLRQLLAAGCKDVKDQHGVTALASAASYGQRDCLNELLAAGSFQDEQDNLGRTPLHRAAMQGDPRCLLDLLAAECDQDARDHDGETPLMLAAQQGCTACIRELLAAGCNKDAKNKHGHKALDIAKQECEALLYEKVHITLMLDCSLSMAGERWQSLLVAYDALRTALAESPRAPLTTASVVLVNELHSEVIQHRAKAGHLADLPPTCPESKRHEAALDKAFQLCLEDLQNSPRDEHNFIVLVLGSAVLQPYVDMEELLESSISQVLVMAVTGSEVEGIFSDFQQQFLKSMTPCSIVSVAEQYLDQAFTTAVADVEVLRQIGGRGGRRKIQVCRMNGDIAEIDLRDDSVRDLVKHLKLQDASLENQDVKLLLSHRELSENYKLQNVPLSERLTMVINAPSRPADEEEVDLSGLKLAPDVRDAVTEHMPKLRDLYNALPARLRQPEDETEAPMTLTDFLSIVQPSHFQSFLRELDTVKIEASVLGDLDSTMLDDLIQSPAQFLQNREEERARRELGTWQQSGHAPLPVVRLYFVGQGRAGKTTTLRRLKREQPRADEISTFGVDIWAGEAGQDLNCSWNETMTSLYDHTAVLCLRKERRRKTEPLTRKRSPASSVKRASSMKITRDRSISDYSDKPGEMPPAPAKPRIPGALPSSDDELDQKDNAARGDGQNMTATKKNFGFEERSPAQEKTPTTAFRDEAPSSFCGSVYEEEPEPKLPKDKGEPLLARPIGDWLVKKVVHDAKDSSEEDPALQPRLQCWDLPGQQEYALCNLLYFQKRGIYVVFCDTSLDIEEAWHHLKFWLWAVAHYAVHAKLGSEGAPPVLVVGTKWSQIHETFNAEEINRRIYGLLLQLPRLRQQLRRVNTRSGWLHPVENFDSDSEKYIQPLRDRLQQLARDTLTPRREWLQAHQQEADAPQHVGMQAETYPVSWLRAHELLTALAAPFKLTVNRTSLEEVLPIHALPGTAVLDKNLTGKHATLHQDFVVPASSHVYLKTAAGRDDDDDVTDSISIEVHCTSLQLDSLEVTLSGMQPSGVAAADVPQLLNLLHALGVLFWYDKPGLRDQVLLNVRKVALALASLMSLRYWDESAFEHSEEHKESIESVSWRMPKDVYRFKTSGVVTWKLLECLWEENSPEERRIMAEVMLSKGIIQRRRMQDEFTVPCCLPLAHLPDPHPPECTVGYIDVDGFVSPNLFPEIAHRLCELKLQAGAKADHSRLRPGAPQIFRNRLEFRSDGSTLVSVSLFPASGSQFRMLRVAVTGATEDLAEEELKKTASELSSIMGFAADAAQLKPMTAEKLKQHRCLRHVDWAGIQDAERFIRCTPCLKRGCKAQCKFCRLSALVEERFIADLSEDLRQVVDRCSLQSLCRPDGSFRFSQMLFPGDVDLEEYLIVDIGQGGRAVATAPEAEDRQEAARELQSLLQKLCQKFDRAGKSIDQPTVYWGGLKAGGLVWSVPDVLNGSKHDDKGAVVRLQDVLTHGSRSRAAKMDFYTKTDLFKTETTSPQVRFFEVTNVIRFGYSSGTGLIRPVTPEKDFLGAVEMCMHEYSGPHPKAMKLAKRLWERSAFLAQREIDLEKHLHMLHFLKPVFSAWPARLSQIAAHAETLFTMLHRTRKKELQDDALNDALADLPALRESLQDVQSQLADSQNEGPHSETAEGLICVQDVIQRLETVSVEQDRRAAVGEKQAAPELVEKMLKELQELLEACVELVLMNRLGSFLHFPDPLVEPLHGKWDFVSDHLPVGARLCGKGTWHGKDLFVVSWNVLNHHFLEHIEKDLQGLRGSSINPASKMSMKRVRQIVDAVKTMLDRQSEMPKAIVCLQGCWPELLGVLEWALRDLHFAVRRTGRELSQKNQEAIIFDSKSMELNEDAFKIFQPYRDSTDKAVAVASFKLRDDGGDANQLRIVTTHLPDIPYGPARKEFCNCMEQLEDVARIPTFLLASLSFSDQVIEAWLRHKFRMDNVKFAEIPYPTTIHQATLLPKRIDGIASVSPEATWEVRALEADEVLPGLQQHVDLLRYRCLGLEMPSPEGVVDQAPKKEDRSERPKPMQSIPQALPQQTEQQSIGNLQRQQLEVLQVELERVRKDLTESDLLREELQDMMASKDAALAQLKQQQKAAVEAEIEKQRCLAESKQAIRKEERAKVHAEQERSELEQQLEQARKDKSLLEAKMEERQEEWKEAVEEAELGQGRCDQERHRFNEELNAEAEACRGRFEEELREAEQARQEECQLIKTELELAQKQQEAAKSAVAEHERSCFENERQRRLEQAAKMQAEQESGRLEARLQEALKDNRRIQLSLDAVAKRLERTQLEQEQAVEERKQEHERWDQDCQRLSTELEAAALKEQHVSSEAEACQGRFDEELREARQRNENLKKALDAFRALHEEALKRKEQRCGDLSEECQHLRTQSAYFAAREGQSEEECEGIGAIVQQLEQKAHDLHEECQHRGTELEKAGKDRKSLQDSLMMVVESKAEALSERQQASLHAAEATGQLHEECQRLKAQLECVQKEQESAMTPTWLEEEQVICIVEQEEAAKRELLAKTQAQRGRQECLRHELRQAVAARANDLSSHDEKEDDLRSAGVPLSGEAAAATEPCMPADIKDQQDLVGCHFLPYLLPSETQGSTPPVNTYTDRLVVELADGDVAQLDQKHDVVMVATARVHKTFAPRFDILPEDQTLHLPPAALAVSPIIRLSPHVESAFADAVLLVIPVCVGACNAWCMQEGDWEQVQAAELTHAFAVLRLYRFCKVVVTCATNRPQLVKIRCFANCMNEFDKRCVVQHVGCDRCNRRLAKLASAELETMTEGCPYARQCVYDDGEELKLSWGSFQRREAVRLKIKRLPLSLPFPGSSNILHVREEDGKRWTHTFHFGSSATAREAGVPPHPLHFRAPADSIVEVSVLINGQPVVLGPGSELVQGLVSATRLSKDLICKAPSDPSGVRQRGRRRWAAAGPGPAADQVAVAGRQRRVHFEGLPMSTDHRKRAARRQAFSPDAPRPKAKFAFDALRSEPAEPVATKASATHGEARSCA
ncbi:ANK3 [Symbiodinium sp. CCMP2592]|nr:ANK3 [Symbiodinium sp. CCMP2592]